MDALVDQTLAGIVLAAGESRRMGQPRQLLPFGKGTILERVVDTLLTAGVGDVVGVLGHLAEMTLPQFSGVIDVSLLTAASSAFAALSLLTLLINVSILSRSAVVSGMAPAALIWSGGVSAPRSGAAARPSRVMASAPAIEAIARREMKVMVFLADGAAFMQRR